MFWKKKNILIVLGLALAVSVANAELYFGTPENIGPNINSSSGDGAAIISPNGCAMYFSSDRPEGDGGLDIFESTRESIDDEWGPAVHLTGPLNTEYDDYPWSISADGLSFYLSSDRPGGYGYFDLYVSTRDSISDPWGRPTNLGSGVNTSSYDYDPFISPDGLSLYFCSNKSGGYGGLDLWLTTRATTSSSWGTPVNLGPVVNSSNSDYAPSLSPDGLLLLFTSTRPGGRGDPDIYMTTCKSIFDPWGAPVNLGSQINTPAVDYYANISDDGSTLYFTSRGHLGYGSYDIFTVPIFYVPTCGDANHPYPLGDFNKDCHVDTEDLLILILDYWLECTAPECD